MTNQNKYHPATIFILRVHHLGCHRTDKEWELFKILIQKRTQ